MADRSFCSINWLIDWHSDRHAQLADYRICMHVGLCMRACTYVCMPLYICKCIYVFAVFWRSKEPGCRCNVQQRGGVTGRPHGHEVDFYRQPAVLQRLESTAEDLPALDVSLSDERTASVVSIAQSRPSASLERHRSSSEQLWDVLRERRFLQVQQLHYYQATSDYSRHP